MSGYVLTAIATLAVWLMGYSTGWRARIGKSPLPTLAEILPPKEDPKPPAIKPQVKA